MIKVYLTDLAAYNNGFLTGEWIALPLDEEELTQKIQQILQTGSNACEYGEVHEEWFITDYEWMEVSLTYIDEYENIYKLNEQLELIQDAESYRLKAMKFLLEEGITLDIEDAYHRAEDVIIHENQSIEDIAYELMNECYGIEQLPSIIANNIDYKSIAYDLELDGNYTIVGNDIFEYIG